MISYKTLSPLKKLGVNFLINFLIWFAASFLYKENDLLYQRVFYSVIMSLLTTIISGYRLIGMLFKKEADS